MNTTDETHGTAAIWAELRSMNASMSAEIRRLSDTLIVTNTKIDNIVTPQGDDHEARLRSLEERRFPYASIAALSAVLGMIAALVGLYLSK